MNNNITGHNLSPRGDGNYELEKAEGSRYDTTYPREGTETHARGVQRQGVLDTTYPREGTETCI